MVPKIYIAGPDVFELNSIDIGQKCHEICQEYGYEGLYPLDNIVDFEQNPRDIAMDIFQANIKQIDRADIVIANLNPFRGKEPDSGTVWECGYAHALGKRVYGYMDDTSAYIEQFGDEDKSMYGDSHIDKQSRVIEDFDYPVNLMIACSVSKIVEGGFEDVLKGIYE